MGVRRNNNSHWLKINQALGFRRSGTLTLNKSLKSIFHVTSTQPQPQPVGYYFRAPKNMFILLRHRQPNLLLQVEWWRRWLLLMTGCADVCVCFTYTMRCELWYSVWIPISNLKLQPNEKMSFPLWNWRANLCPLWLPAMPISYSLIQRCNTVLCVPWHYRYSAPFRSS